MKVLAELKGWWKPGRWWPGCREWLRRRDWNPVLVKELRQALRSRILMIGLCFQGLLMVLFGALWVALDGAAEMAGFLVMGTMAFWMNLVTIGAVAQQLLGRTAQDREDGMELLYATRLTPAEVVRGKLYAAAYVGFLYVCAGTPLLALTTLLGGVDLRMVLAAAWSAWSSALFIGVFALLLACTPWNRVVKYGLFVLTLLAAWIAQAAWSVIMFMGSAHAGFGLATPTGPGLTAETLLSVAWPVAVCALGYAGAVALLSPSSANRALPLRAWATVCWLVVGGLSMACAWVDLKADRVLVWGIVTVALMVPGIGLLVMQRDGLRPRVRRTIPQWWPWRVAAFLFYNGRAGGLAWGSLLLAGTLGVMWWAVSRWHGPVSLWADSACEEAHAVLRTTAVVLYLLAYTGTGLYLQRRFWPRASGWKATLPVILVAGWAMVVPYVWMALSGPIDMALFASYHGGSITNALLVVEWKDLRSHLWVSGLWFAAGVVLNLPWLVQQARAFRRAEPGEAAGLNAVPPVLSGAG